MKKLICILFALMLVTSMTVNTYAVTPPLGVPDMPEIPNISGSVKVKLPDGVFDDYIPDIDPEEPTEPEEPVYPDWCDWVKGWLEFWKGIMENHWCHPIR